MVLPSTGGLDFESAASGGREAAYFALQPSNLSSPSSDEILGSRFLGGGGGEHLPSLEHDRSNAFPGVLYYYWHKPCITITRKRMLISCWIIAGILFTIILAGELSNSVETNSQQQRQSPAPPDPEYEPPDSSSKLRTFNRHAVCADSKICAFIGKTMLDSNGTAVDAALATLICNGLLNMQSMGLGGGFVMTIYKKDKGRAYYLNARDAAPIAAHMHMFDGVYKPNDASLHGGLSISVPGELAGYWEAHQRFGKLPWSELFAPSIALCEKGWNLTRAMYYDLDRNATDIRADATLRELFVDPKTGEFYKPGSLIKPKKLCETLRIIAEKNATELYNGTLGQQLVNDIRKRGSLITFKDLNDYRAKWEDPSMTKINGNMKLFSSGLPGSGPLLNFIMNLLDEFNFTPEDLSTSNLTVRTYHRLIEAWKYAFALRTRLGDVQLPKMSELLNNLTSKEYARSIRMKISDDRTSNDPEYYGAARPDKSKDHGTAHISVIADNGDAVSVTSSINVYFGSGIVSESTGILLNDGINDFGFPGMLNYFHIPSSENNYIAPGKRPLSSMSPAILVDRNGEVKMVVGAAGGTKIPTAMSLVMARILWMGNTVKQAVDAPRLHHQLYPMEVSYQFGITRPVIEGLRQLGHKTSLYRTRESVVCVLYRKNGTIYANADYRKNGEVYGD